jgi:hypothetical protein
MRKALGRAAVQFARRAGHVFAGLGLRITAVIYAALALSFGAAGWKSWRADARAAELPHHALLLSRARPATEAELALALVFVYFALSSWMRALRHG